MKSCQACNSANDSDAVFCTSCGARLNVAEPAAMPSPKQKSATGTPLWKIIVGGCVLVGLVIALIHYTTNLARQTAMNEVEKTIPKITDIIPIPKSKEEVAKIVNETMGNDQTVGEIRKKANKLPTRLKEVEYTKDYKYKKTNCTDLLTDTFQQGAYVVQGELADITQISVEKENKIGRMMAKQIRKKFRGALDLDRDRQWLLYVNKIGKRLITNVNRPGINYNFHVIRGKEINAFAIPGGGIYVYTGLLDRVENEAQLAAILAHEVKHVDLRHCIFVVQMIMQLPEAMHNPYLVAAGKMITNPYSGRQEADADRRGVDLIYSFGYSPHQFVAFWQGMVRLDKSAGKRRKSQSPLGNVLGNVFEEVDNVLRSHPPAAKRVCLLKNYIIDLNAQYPTKSVYVGKWNFQSKVTMFEKKV